MVGVGGAVGFGVIATGTGVAVGGTVRSSIIPGFGVGITFVLSEVPSIRVFTRSPTAPEDPTCFTVSHKRAKKPPSLSDGLLVALGVVLALSAAEFFLSNTVLLEIAFFDIEKVLFTVLTTFFAAVFALFHSSLRNSPS